MLPESDEAKNTEWSYELLRSPKLVTTELNRPNQARGDCFRPYKDFRSYRPYHNTPLEQQTPEVAPCKLPLVTHHVGMHFSHPTGGEATHR